MTTLTPTEIESLRIAIAEECGWKYSPECEFKGSCGCGFVWETGSGLPSNSSPLYTTSLDAIQAAAMERFKTRHERASFTKEMGQQGFDSDCCQWQLTAIDWCIAFARTAKIWKYKF